MADARRGYQHQRRLHDLLTVGPVGVRSDADLIEHFRLGHGEVAEAAFAALVERHGPLVLAVSRRIVRDDHAAEDVFQAVFLILARKARSVQVDDSLGRWLHGVTRRVASRARHLARREIPPPAAPVREPTDPALAAARAEIRLLVAQEVAALARKYREPVRLFHLDGLGHDGVAEALGIPVGTVRSRLSRARSLLRTRLADRGVAPGSLAVWFSTRPAVVAVPAALARTTLANLGGGTIGGSSPLVLLLVHTTMRHLLMKKLIGLALLTATLGGLASGMAVLANGDAPRAPLVAAQAPPLAPVPAPNPAPPPAESLEAQFRRIAAEFQAAREHSWTEGKKAQNKFEESKIINRLAPDLKDYSRRVIDLAAAHPREPGARDALIWVIHQPQQSDGGDYGDDFARAVRLLIQCYADDPEVARAGLGMENVIGERRDIFLNGIYANAQNREAKGLIRLARADYLIKQAGFSASARKFPGRQVITYESYDDQGKRVEKRDTGSNEDEGYRVYLRMLDPDFVRKEGERLYEEVIAEYADIPYITLGYREMEREAREHPSATITDPEEKKEMIETEQYLTETKLKTLGQIAAKKLDEVRNLAVGKVAPDFVGTGADGKPIRLADYRGRVVALVYWFSTCGPCLTAIPDEKELAAKLKGRPFTWLGIVTDGKGEEARTILDREGITWPNILSGGDKVAEQYHVSSNPDYFIIDAAGVIRSKGNIGASSRAEFIEKLVQEAEAKGPLRP